ncbi:MAG: hypothetical protein RLN87_01815, partial [Parasphingopyxis sp.]
ADRHGAHVRVVSYSRFRVPVCDRVKLVVAVGPCVHISGGPPPFGKADRSRFLQVLDRVLVEMGR